MWPPLCPQPPRSGVRHPGKPQWQRGEQSSPSAGTQGLSTAASGCSPPRSPKTLLKTGRYPPAGHAQLFANQGHLIAGGTPRTQNRLFKRRYHDIVSIPLPWTNQLIQRTVYDVGFSDMGFSDMVPE